MIASEVERQVRDATLLLSMPAAADFLATVMYRFGPGSGLDPFLFGPFWPATVAWRALSLVFTPFIVLALVAWSIAWARRRPLAWWLPAAAALNAMVLAYQVWWLVGR